MSSRQNEMPLAHMATVSLAHDPSCIRNPYRSSSSSSSSSPIPPSHMHPCQRCLRDLADTLSDSVARRGPLHPRLLQQEFIPLHRTLTGESDRAHDPRYRRTERAGNPLYTSGSVIDLDAITSRYMTNDLTRYQQRRQHQHHEHHEHHEHHDYHDHHEHHDYHDHHEHHHRHQQQQHERSSPPIQPGEHHRTAKLPSFSEFLHTTGTETPPRSPSYRNESARSSFCARPSFDDVAWSENKRRRTDTLGELLTGPSGNPNYHAADHRRMSTTIDPALPSYGSQHTTMRSAGTEYHHRSSYPFAPANGPFEIAGTDAYTCRQSSSYQPSGSVYVQHTQRHGFTPQGLVQQPPPPPQEIYNPRPRYYTVNGTLYHGVPPPGHVNPYGEFRIQQHRAPDVKPAKKRRGNLPKESTNTLKQWFKENRQAPYPSDSQKSSLCDETKLSSNQVSNWFINARRRAPLKEKREREAAEKAAKEKAAKEQAAKDKAAKKD